MQATFGRRPSQESLSLLEEMAGKTVRSANRIVFEDADGVDEDAGSVELYLDDDSVLLFNPEQDGELLRVERGPWHDPYKNMSGSELRAFINQHGRLTRVADHPSVRPLVGLKIRSFEWVTNELGNFCGISFPVGQAPLHVLVIGGDLHVYNELPEMFSKLN